MVTPPFCIDRLEELQSRLHGKQRQKLRENKIEAIRIHEEMVLEGKLYHAINQWSGNSLLLTHYHPLPLQLEKYLSTHLIYIMHIQSTI